MRLVHKVIVWLPHAIVVLELLRMSNFTVELETTEILAAFRLFLWRHFVFVPIVDFSHWFLIKHSLGDTSEDLIRTHIK